MQEPLIGTEFNVMGLGDGAGGLLGSCAVRKLIISDKGKGNGSVVVRDLRLDEITRRVMAATRWSGPFELEFIRDQRDDGYRLIEINPRFPAWVGFPTQLGANFRRHGPALSPARRVAKFHQPQSNQKLNSSMNLQSYVAPTIRRVSQTTANPQRLGRVPVMDAIDGVAVSSLIAAHGSPLFVFSEASLREKIRAARQAFESVYPDVTFAWSYKTNSLNAICRVFHQEGSIAEVVSGFEYEKARHNGMPGDQIIYNGPWKSVESLRRAVSEGAMIQVDNRDEIVALAR